MATSSARRGSPWVLIAVGVLLAGALPSASACICTKELNLVCGADGKTYDNPCLARCANQTFTQGTCKGTDCILADCSKEPAQVCATMRDGSVKEFLNSCLADCDPEVVSHNKGICPDLDCPVKMCSTVSDPVCATMNSGEEMTITNECIARCSNDVLFLKEGSCAGDSPKGSLVKCDGTEWACPLIYAPVCVRYKNGTRSTFGNACQAQCEKDVESSTPGECSPASCACPKIRKPVCGVEDGETYANSCLAECAGRTWTEGACITCANVRCASGPPVCATMKLTFSQVTLQNECLASCNPKVLSFAPGACPKPCPCPKNIDWVCGVEDGENYANPCLAKCAGRTFTKGRCKSCETVRCAPGKPVCATMKLTGEKVTIASPCLANCNPKVASYKPGPCTCQCPAIYAPVCGSDGKTYGNDCAAACAGITDWKRGECPCVCPEIWAPVCARLTNGQLGSFSNDCFAGCDPLVDKAFPLMRGRCKASCTKQCEASSQVSDPVCVLRQSRKSFRPSLTFPTPCLAQCQGGASPKNAIYYQGKCRPACDTRCNAVKGTQLREFRKKYGAKANGRVCCGNAREYPSLCYASCVGNLGEKQLEQCRPGSCTGARAELMVNRSNGAECGVTCFNDPCFVEPKCTAPDVKCMSIFCPSFFRFSFMGTCSAQWLDLKTGQLQGKCPAPAGGKNETLPRGL